MMTHLPVTETGVARFILELLCLPALWLLKLGIQRLIAAMRRAA
jgi:hypothetical protein